jgi:hypothetical protein
MPQIAPMPAKLRRKMLLGTAKTLQAPTTQALGLAPADMNLCGRLSDESREAWRRTFGPKPQGLPR